MTGSLDISLDDLLVVAQAVSLRRPGDAIPAELLRDMTRALDTVANLSGDTGWSEASPEHAAEALIVAACQTLARLPGQPNALKALRAAVCLYHAVREPLGVPDPGLDDPTDAKHAGAAPQGVRPFQGGRAREFDWQKRADMK